MRAIWIQGLVAALGVCAIAALNADEGGLPEGFVRLRELAPTVFVDLRYHGEDNFVGSRVEGYESGACVMSRAAAEAIRAAQDELRGLGLSLIIYDAYRPQRAVDHFVRWAADSADRKTKDRHYPDIPKDELFERGYIAEESSHSRGSAVDLTLGSVKDGRATPLDMGTPFDFFGKESWTANPEATPQQRANRLLLKTILEKRGFVNYSKEWWHYRLRDEPFPDKAFDFPIR